MSSNIALAKAHAAGVACARDWAATLDDAPPPPASRAAWRARCLAAAINKYESAPEFLTLLAAWEQGFDVTMGAPATPVQPMPDPEPVHKEFSWLPARLAFDHRAQFVATTLDVCRGIDVCIGLVQSSNSTRLNNIDADPQDATPPMLGIVETEQLLFLSKASARLLADTAEKHIEWLGKQAIEPTIRTVRKGTNNV